MPPSIGVVVPAFRPDVDVLSSYVRALDERLDPAAIRVELDDPAPGVRSALSDLPATVHAASARRGKGGAITFGFERLDTDVLAFADADGSTPAESIAAVVDPVRNGDADLSVGSRRHPDADVRSHQTLARRRLGDAFAWTARRLLDADLHDFQCGAKALTRDAWETVRRHLYEPGFAWDVELVAIAGALDQRIVEVPVVWEDMPDSTVAPVRTALELGWALLRSRHRARRLRGHRVHRALARDGTIALVDRFADNE
ncbi:glycosyltransferase [Halostella sp. JP-L12]|uniref:glycosyltransferase n=1 Tax=Halostella TaxID=1843185 RepID=UPI000EF78ED6|nr:MULTISPECIES: glycosyltransferase [Halostella]NHN47403.1 glycosyltransferase [Halostella sp. JP-L12]